MERCDSISKMKKAESLIHRTFLNPWKDWTCSLSFRIATRLGTNSWCFPCFYVKEVHIESFSCSSYPTSWAKRRFVIWSTNSWNPRPYDKVLRNKVVLMVKILWRSDRVKEMTWKTEASMRKHYQYLFFDWVSKFLG